MTHKLIYDHLQINWQSPQNETLLNPRWPEADKASIHQGLNASSSFKGHVWLTSSGSTGRLKCAALSKEAILASAAAVNRHLQSDGSDVWFNPLPFFHVGGLGIWARGFLSQAKVVDGWTETDRWNPLKFVDSIVGSKATLTSLVPAHIYDLISLQLPAPPSLRAVIVGGGALSEKLYYEAVRRGWKLLPSYGLTECASQVATAQLGSWQNLTYPLLHVLDHVNLIMDAQHRIQIKSPSLLTVVAERDALTGKWSVVDPKCGGWLTTQDTAVLENGAIKAISRADQFIKIGGESVDLTRLERVLEEVLLQEKWRHDAAIFAFPDKRLGHIIQLAVEADENCVNIPTIVDFYNQRVLPFECIRFVHYVDSIPRSPLNKLLLDQLLKKIIQ